MPLSYENLDPKVVDGLGKVREWAKYQLKAEGTPWAGFHYMRLIDSISSILQGRHYVLEDEERQSETPSPPEFPDVHLDPSERSEGDRQRPS